MIHGPLEKKQMWQAASVLLIRLCFVVFCVIEKNNNNYCYSQSYLLIHFSQLIRRIWLSVFLARWFINSKFGLQSINQTELLLTLPSLNEFLDGMQVSQLDPNLSLPSPSKPPCCLNVLAKNPVLFTSPKHSRIQAPDPECFYHTTTPLKLRITIMATNNTLLCWGLWTNLAQLESRDRQLTRRWQSAKTRKKALNEIMDIYSALWDLQISLLTLEHSLRERLHLSGHLRFPWGWPLNATFDCIHVSVQILQYKLHNLNNWIWITST